MKRPERLLRRVPTRSTFVYRAPHQRSFCRALQIQRIGRHLEHPVVPFPHSTSRQLTALSAALGDPSVDLESALRTLTSQFCGVVPGFLGLTVTIDISGVPVTLTTIDQCTVGSAQGCLLLALAPEAGFRAGDSVVLYAACPEAFSSLIAGTGSSHPGLEGCTS